MDTGPQEMSRALCGDCEWVLDIIAVPIELSIAANAMGRVFCPMCGATNILHGTVNRALTEAERLHKSRLDMEHAQRRVR